MTSDDAGAQALEVGSRRPSLSLRLQDGVILGVMVVLAAACIVYEYLLSHYAGRVLGLMEHAIFTMIGVMIVSMGIGSLLARHVQNPNVGFLTVELALAVTGVTGILMIAGFVAFAEAFPHIIAANFRMPRDVVPTGGLTQWVQGAVGVVPYMVGAVIGILIGMEIPFIARVREELYRSHLVHNTGTVYGVDYIGAGIGAAVFITALLALPPEQVSVGVAAVNLLVGGIFLVIRRRHIAHVRIFAAIHIVVLAFLLFLAPRASAWHDVLENTLYRDKVIFSHDTEFQHITLTERRVPGAERHISLFLNGRLQFCSCDEAIYHGMLVAPPLLASARTDRILIVGGGDGLALRNVLRWNPRHVTLLELDREMIRLFSEPGKIKDGVTNEALLALNERSFSDPRVKTIYGDAFNSAGDLLRKGQRFDTIIVDLPDPGNPDLNKVYSTRFYRTLRGLLAADGVLSIQSTSPYHARDAFLTVGVTLQAAGFGQVARYRANVPSFGEWGWTLASIRGGPLEERVLSGRRAIPAQSWASLELIRAAFVFPKGFLEREKQLSANTIGRNRLYFLYRDAWSREEIIVDPHS